MNKYIKWNALLLAIVLTVLPLLAGCNSEDSEDTTAPSASVQYTPEPAPDPFVLPNKTVSLGRMENTAYVNDYAGYRCDFERAWQYYLANKLQKLPENLSEALNSAEVGDTELYQLQDLRADSRSGRIAIRISYQLLNDYDRRRYAVMEEETIIDLLLEQKDLLISQYARDGIEVVRMEKKAVTFLGEERTAIYTTAKKQGADYYILTIYDYQLGRYAVTTAFSSLGQDATNELAQMFTATE